jgi:multidrug resistance protein, MATE family
MDRRATAVPTRIGVGSVLGLAWPIMISMLSRTAMTTADTIFVGHLGTSAVAAIGLASTLSFVYIAFGWGLLGGVNVAVSQATGAGRSVNEHWWQAMWMALGLGVVGLLVTPLGPLVLPLLGASDEATALGSAWMSVRMAGAGLVFAQVGLIAWFQGRGDTRTPMVATLITNVLNIALDPMLIFGWGPFPALGIAGAAWATNISLLVGLGWLLVRSRPGKLVGLRRGVVREVVRLGSPMAMHFALDVLAFTAFVAILARVGEEALAAHVIVVRIVSVSFLPGHAVSEATSVLVGQAVGAGRHGLAKEAWRSGTRLAVGLMAAMGAVFLFLPGPLLGVFEPSDEVAEAGRALLLVAAGFQLFDAVAMVGFGALKGAGDTRFTMVLGVSAAWLIKLPVGLWLAVGVGWGAGGAWLGMTVEIVLLAIAVSWRLMGTRWLPALVSTSEPTEAEKLALAAK